MPNIPLTRVIHENMSVIAMYAFATPVLREVRRDVFKGEWKFLDQMLFEIPIPQIERAIIELGTMLRVLDNEQQLGDHLKGAESRNPGTHRFGEVTKPDGTTEPLWFRDMTNKLIHAASYEWDFSDAKAPAIICRSADTSRWRSARIEVQALLQLTGGLIS